MISLHSLEILHIIVLLGIMIDMCMELSMKDSQVYISYTSYYYHSILHTNFFLVPGSTELWTSADPVYKTQFSLMCRAIIAPQYLNLLAPYIDIEWSYPESQPQNDSSVLEEMDRDNFTSSLTFLSPNSSHNGIYTCKSILRLPHRKIELTPNNSFLLSLEG